MVTELKPTAEQHQPCESSACGEIVFFDGVCGLCNGTVDFLLRHDHQKRLRYASLQGETANKCLPREVREELNTLVLKSDAGQLYFRSAAVVRILLRLGITWKFCAALLWLVPWPIRDAGYCFVSRFRYRLFGRRETCRMPTEAEQDRILP